jgi:hypothetical protein
MPVATVVVSKTSPRNNSLLSASFHVNYWKNNAEDYLPLSGEVVV